MSVGTASVGAGISPPLGRPAPSRSQEMAREFYGKYGGPRASMQAFLEYLRSHESTPDEAKEIQDLLVRGYGLYRIAERIDDGHLVLTERVGWSDTTQGSGIASGQDAARTKERGAGSRVTDAEAAAIDRRRREAAGREQQEPTSTGGAQIRAGTFGTKGQETVGYLRVPGGPVNVVERDTFRVTKLAGNLFEIDVDGAKTQHALFNVSSSLRLRMSPYGAVSQTWLPKVNKWVQEMAQVGQSMLVQMHSGDHVIVDREGYAGQQGGWQF